MLIKLSFKLSMMISMMSLLACREEAEVSFARNCNPSQPPKTQLTGDTAPVKMGEPPERVAGSFTPSVDSTLSPAPKVFTAGGTWTNNGVGPVPNPAGSGGAGVGGGTGGQVGSSNALPNCDAKTLAIAEAEKPAPSKQMYQLSFTISTQPDGVPAVGYPETDRRDPPVEPGKNSRCNISFYSYNLSDLPKLGETRGIQYTRPVDGPGVKGYGSCTGSSDSGNTGAPAQTIYYQIVDTSTIEFTKLEYLSGSDVEVKVKLNLKSTTGTETKALVGIGKTKLINQSEPNVGR